LLITGSSWLFPDTADDSSTVVTGSSDSNWKRGTSFFKQLFTLNIKVCNKFHGPEQDICNFSFKQAYFQLTCFFTFTLMCQIKFHKMAAKIII